jgi:hypothetical protein
MRVQGLVATAVALAAAVSVARAQGDPSVGTWKLNLAKSKYNAGAPPKSSTVVIAAAGKGFKVTSKDAAVTGRPDYESVAIKRTGDGTSGERKKAGKVVQTFTRSVSADGKTLTTSAKGTNAAGGKVDNVQVYDKQ